jgi:hypothetical protein
MSRKKRRPGRGRGKPKEAPPARFAVGDSVRVKPGTTDPEFQDIPLGGWAGTVQEVDSTSSPPLYLVEWGERTLEQMHPVVLKRAERDGVEVDSLWLGEADLEPDRGEPAVMEQPTAIRTRPLRTNDQEDRIRAIFDLTSDDPLPAATAENVRKYHAHLASRLSFPFQAKFSEFTDDLLPRNVAVTVVGLCDAEDCDEEEGVLCNMEQEGEVIEFPLAELVEVLGRENWRLVEDYSYWFGNWPADDLSGPGSAADLLFDAIPNSAGKASRLKGLAMSGVYGGVCGVVLGALVGASDIAKYGALAGAVILAIVGCIAGTKYGMVFGAANQMRYGKALGGVVGAMLGAAVGAMVGAMAVGILGTLAGAIVGGMVGRVIKPGPIGPALGVLLGAGAGAVGLAFLWDQDKALTGLCYGGLAGAGAGIVLFAMLVGALVLAARGREGG